MTSKALKRLLETPMWPEKLQAETVYQRIHDDHDGEFHGRLSVQFDRQGDAWVLMDRPFPPIRFRTWGGGGMSLRVRNALVLLAEAIRLDNEECPQQQQP